MALSYKVGAPSTYATYTAVTTGAAIDCSRMAALTVQVVSSGVTAGAALTFDASLDGTSWATGWISGATLNANGAGMYNVKAENDAVRYIRVNCSAYTDGTHVIKYSGVSRG